MTIKNLLHWIIVSMILVQFYGCIAAAYPAALIGEGVIGAMDKVKVDAAVTPGVTKEQLSQIKRILFYFEEETATEKMFLSKGQTGVFVDNLTIEMMKLGYECIARQKLKKSLDNPDNQNTGTADIEDTIKAAKAIGVQAIITGIVRASTSSRSSGLMSMKFTSSTVIQNATLKVVDVESGDTLMVIAINYKRGKKPDAAAHSIANIMKSKFENPFEEKIKKK